MIANVFFICRPGTLPLNISVPDKQPPYQLYVVSSESDTGERGLSRI
jgi:hypothetical protein